MKPTEPHDLLDDLMAASLHGELTPGERAQLETRLQNDPAARAAYQEAQHMHDLLEKTYRDIQPDPAFEQRMISGVRRKIQDEKNHRETAWESLVVLWTATRGFFRRPAWQYAAVMAALLAVMIPGFYIVGSRNVTSVFSTINSQVMMAQTNESLDALTRQQNAAGVLFGETPSHPLVNFNGIKKAKSDTSTKSLDKLAEREAVFFAGDPISVPLHSPPKQKDLKAVIEDQGINYVDTAKKGIPLSGYVDTNYTYQFAGKGEYATPDATTTPRGGTIRGVPINNAPSARTPDISSQNLAFATSTEPQAITKSGETGVVEADRIFPYHDIKQKVTVRDGQTSVSGTLIKEDSDDGSKAQPTDNAGTAWDDYGKPQSPSQKSAESATADANRKLIRNAELELEVKSFQNTVDRIELMAKAAGGYVDTSNSQRGGNGKLQGTVVAKVLPQNLDDFLLKLRDLGELKNQTLKTDDVTKAYFDTQARLENSRRMETQLQELLKHDNGKISDLLQVERELGRVRGEIEQMQGELKVYDFQVQYATVAMQINEKDLNQAAAYLLKENDDFSLYATDVEATFQQARHAADDVKAQILTADLHHDSGTNVSAELNVMVAPDQVEAFLSQVRALGRVDHFTRQTQRVAKDGGDSDQPADQTLTEKDKVQVHVAIRSDDESRKQVALTVVTTAVDDALDKAKTAALAVTGTEILGSSLNKASQRQSTGQLRVRVPGKDYPALLEVFRTLGRTASFNLQRNDNSGPGASGDDAPVIISLSLTDDETPLQQTDMSVLASDVDDMSQQIKKDAAATGVEVKASGFQRQPNGVETAEMTFRLPMSKYPAFVESLKKLGKVELLTVQRQDRPDQARIDESAPAEINLHLHNQGNIVADENGLWATLRRTFGDGAGALFGSVRIIGVILAFLAPWIFVLLLAAWFGRRIYVWRRSRR